MSDHHRVLFVCTGNIFRSMTAEYALKARVGTATLALVGSAGLERAPHGVMDFVAAHLCRKGFDVSGHQPRELTRPILGGATLIVAMGFDHRDQILERFGRRVPLFSEVAYGLERPLPDVWEMIPNWRSNLTAARAYAEKVMDYIVDGMPDFVRHMDRFQTGDQA